MKVKTRNTVIAAIIIAVIITILNAIKFLVYSPATVDNAWFAWLFITIITAVVYWLIILRKQKNTKLGVELERITITSFITTFLFMFIIPILIIPIPLFDLFISVLIGELTLLDFR
jgi:hypothetical protein